MKWCKGFFVVVAATYTDSTRFVCRQIKKRDGLKAIPLLCRCIGLSDNLEARVFVQHFGNDDAFGRLVVLDEGSHDAREGEGTAVQRVG